MNDSLTSNSSHALPHSHPFLDKVKIPLEKKADIEARVEQRTARGIEAALATLDFTGVTGKLEFKVSVSDDGYQVFFKPTSSIILPE